MKIDFNSFIIKTKHKKKRYKIIKIFNNSLIISVFIILLLIIVLYVQFGGIEE